MGHKYTSQVQTDIFVTDYGIDLDYEKEFNELDFTGIESLLEFFLKEGFLSKHDETKPDKPKGIGIYELKSYPNGRFVFKDGNVYQASVGAGNSTSSIFIHSNIEGEPNEWDLIVAGA